MKMKYISWLSILSVLALSGCEDGMERAAEIGDSVCVLASRAGVDASVWEDDTSMKVRNYTVTDDNGEAREDVFTFGGGSWTPGKPGKYERVLEWNGNSTIDLVAYIEKTGTGFDKVELQAGDDDAVEQKANNLDGFDYLYSINYGLEKPADGKLSLEFGHVMSKIVINVKGRDLSSVEHVMLKSPRVMTFDGEQWTPDVEDKVDIRLPYEGSSSFVAYVVPHVWVRPEVSLYMVGETDEPKLAKYRNDIVLEVGKEYSLSIDLNTGDLSISFDSSVDVKEWGGETQQEAVVIPKWSGKVAESFAGGSGTEENPYLISNGEQLALMAQEGNKHPNSGSNVLEYNGIFFRLTSDIDLDNKEWMPIGNGISKGKFAGSFDGDGHRIYNLKVHDESGKMYIGLFGDSRPSAETYIKNLTIVNPDLYSNNTTASNVSAVVGYAHQNLTIENCKVIGGKIEGGKNAGAIMGNGQVANIVIKNCEVTDMEVRTGANIGANTGGIVGLINNNLKVIACSFDGKISGSSGILGGIVGATNNKSNSVIFQNILGCYSNVDYDVSGPAKFGGIVGTNKFANIRGCYSVLRNIGVADTKSVLGGIIGEFTKSTMQDGASNISSSIIKSFSVSELNAIGNNVSEPENLNMDDSEVPVLMKVDAIGEEEVNMMNAALEEDGLEYVASEDGFFPYVISNIRNVEE